MFTRRALAAAAALSLIGCAGSGIGTVAGGPAPATIAQGTPNGIAGVAGSYTLVAVDGHALPYAGPTKGSAALAPVEVLGGTLVIRADGTFDMSTNYRHLEAAGGRLFNGQFSGACAPSDNGYRLYMSGGGETAVTASGNTVTVDNDGVLFRYVKAS